MLYCWYCGSRKHTAKNCPKTWSGQANRRMMRCEYCGSTKHNLKACPKTSEGSSMRKWRSREIEDEYIED